MKKINESSRMTNKASQLLVLFSRYEEELGNHEFNLCEKTYNEFVDLVESLNISEDVKIELRELFDINAASPHNHKISDRFTKLVLSLGKSKSVMLEDGNGAYGVPEEVKSEIMTLINEYAEYFVRSITDDNFPDVKVNKKKQELFGLIESL